MVGACGQDEQHPHSQVPCASGSQGKCRKGPKEVLVRCAISGSEGLCSTPQLV